MYTVTNNGKAKEDQKKDVGGSEKQPGEEIPQEPQREQPPKKSNFQRIGPVESVDLNGRMEYRTRRAQKRYTVYMAEQLE